MKKRIVLSSSGNGMAEKFVRCLIGCFGNSNMEYIASRIADACNKNGKLLGVEVNGETIVITGDSSVISVNDGMLMFAGVNVSAEDYMLVLGR